MADLVFIVEEASKEEFLREFLKRWSTPTDLEITYLVAGGHSQVRRLIASKLRNWRKPNTTFVILCDQDSANCVERKAELSKQVPPHHRSNTVVRIVCTELEGWYLTDRSALHAALPALDQTEAWPAALLGPPDAIQRPARQIAAITRFRKTTLAREMGQRISLQPNTSHSFNLFLQTLNQILADPNIDHPPPRP